METNLEDLVRDLGVIEGISLMSDGVASDAFF